MQKENKIVCLVGESGSGKTTLYEMLRALGYKVVDSYTTRAPRVPNEPGHIFLLPEAFDAIRDDLVAYTEFNGFEYGVTKEQVEESHFYIIDPDGVDYFAEKIGRENFVVIYVYANEEFRFERMKKERGVEAALSRINHDREKFRKFIDDEDYNAILYNNFEDTLDANVERLIRIYKRSNGLEV